MSLSIPSGDIPCNRVYYPCLVTKLEHPASVKSMTWGSDVLGALSNSAYGRPA